MRVLVVEDSDSLRSTLSQALQNSGYVVDSAADGEEGLWFAESNDYDVVVLDIMLPKMDGLTVLERLRQNGCETNVLLLTAKDSLKDKVHGLQIGADDYLVKPFDLEELLARVWALCRRKYGRKDNRIEIEDLTLDLNARTVSRNGSPIYLTAREFKVFEYLALRRGQIVSKTEIESNVYDSEAELMSNVVESTICDLRRKLTPDADDTGNIIYTRRGMGYYIKKEQSE